MSLRVGDILHEAGEPRSYLYFPVDCVISLVYTTIEGTSAELAIIGNEGVVGIALFMGGMTTPRRAIVQTPGKAFRLKAAVT